MTSTATSSAGRPGTGVHALCENNARRAPDSVAVVYGALHLTYGELDRRAGEVAQRLRALGLRPGGRVAVCLERGPDVLVAMLGVLKAGGAYVPLEPTAPGHVLRDILADAGVDTVLTVERHRVTVAQGADRRIVCLDADAAAPTAAAADGGAFDARVKPSLACVLYTSGTTGVPKGVLIKHGTLLTAYRAWKEVYQLSPADRHLQVTATEFAGFTADWVRALCSGGTLVMAEHVDSEDRTDDAGLHELIIAERVTVLTGAVAVIKELGRRPRVHGLGGLRLIAGTGELWDLDEQYALRALAGPDVRILNTYALTEAAGSGAYFELPAGPPPVGGSAQLSLIGAPFPGLTISVLDEAGAPLGPGGVGEIAVSGPGVALGYLNGPRFDSDHLVRTGDLGLRQASGCLEFVGRRGDHTEVEAVLRGYSAVPEYLVAEIDTAQGGRALAAYVVAADGGAVDPDHLRSYLSERLPAGRAPQVVVPVASLPRTRAGRADRGGLPLPVQRGAGRAVGGKAGRSTEPGRDSVGGIAFVALFFAVLAWFLTDAIWPGSTDVSGVPAPWAALFEGLYACECLAFGLGVVFLGIFGDLMSRGVVSGALAKAAHLAVVWLLVAWWPQDNFYRLAAKTDWPRQAALVYGFNITLMIAAAVVAAYLVSGLRKR